MDPRSDQGLLRGPVRRVDPPVSPRLGGLHHPLGGAAPGPRDRGRGPRVDDQAQASAARWGRWGSEPGRTSQHPAATRSAGGAGMSSVLVVAVLVVLTAVAVFGAARPYRRSAVPALEPLSDPLEDRRLALLISLRDLETARGSGAIEEEDYARLRAETEGRMARVLRAIDSKEHSRSSPDGRSR